MNKENIAQLIIIQSSEDNTLTIHKVHSNTDEKTVLACDVIITTLYNTLLETGFDMAFEIAELQTKKLQNN